MANRVFRYALVASVITGLLGVSGARGEVSPSARASARKAMSSGGQYLLSRQQSDGSWLHTPPITGLACMALQEAVPAEKPLACRLAIEKGRRFILDHVQADGAICPPDRSYVNYSTAICLTALATIGNPADIPIMRRARQFLIDSQLDEDNAEVPTESDDPFYGGIGYGSGGPTRPDLSNTQWALEALYLTDHLARPPLAESEQETRETDLAWEKARQFLAAVQNLQKTKKGAWLVTDEKDGGFIYRPDQSKASQKLEEESLRSYGSMTYAGLKSMIYARLKRDDPRVQAALDWARKHYTLEENPGMGAEGHFYYLHTFAKALDVYGLETVATSDGKMHNWREDLIRTLTDLQQPDGSWLNERSGRWRESMPELVTTYALLSLARALP